MFVLLFIILNHLKEREREKKNKEREKREYYQKS
jgi:hypothetical protein